MKKSNYFLALLIDLGALFALVCFSIIFAVTKSSSVAENVKVEHFMGFAYLFIHLIVLAFLFYFTLKAYLTKSQLVSIFMTNEDGSLNKKARVRAIVGAFIFGIIGVYFGLISFGLDIPLSFFALGLKLALMNVGISASSVCVFLAVFKPSNEK